MGHVTLSPRDGEPAAHARRFTTVTFMWIVAAVLLLLWLGVVFLWHVQGGFMHVFLVGAIGTALMNLVANYWSQE